MDPRLAPTLMFALVIGACDVPAPGTGADPTFGRPALEEGTVARGMQHPVVAIDSAGRYWPAAVSSELGWPALVMEDGRLERFPGDATPGRDGRPLPVEALSLLATADTFLHAAWSDGQYLHYARFDTATLASEWRRLVDADHARPTLAADADGGTITIAYAHGHASRLASYRMMVLEGSLERGFSEPQHADPGSGDRREDEPGAYFVSIAGVATDSSGTRHLAYQSTTLSCEMVLDYVVERGEGWEHAGRWVGLSTYTLDPSLAVHGRMMHLAYVPEARDRLVHVHRDLGHAQAIERDVFVEGLVRYARIDLAGDGSPRFAVEYRPPDAAGADLSSILYLKGEGAEAGVRLGDRSGPAELLRLSRGTGGSIIAPSGEWIIAYERGAPGAEASFEVAVRRE